MSDQVAEVIEHAKITDGFGELAAHLVYRPLATYCGVCDVPILVSPREQKYLLETKGVPVKGLRQGAAYCARCAARRSRINRLAQGEQWRAEPNGAAELDALRSEEQADQAQSRRRFRQADWPYAAR